MAVEEPARTARLNMRISPDALELIRTAAQSLQQDVSAFVLGVAMERARAVVLENQVLQLGPQGIADLEKSLDAEAIVVPKLASLVRNARENAPAGSIPPPTHAVPTD